VGLERHRAARSRFQPPFEVAYVGRRGLHGQQELDSQIAVPADATLANPDINVNALNRMRLWHDCSTNNVASSRYNGLQVDVKKPPRGCYSESPIPFRTARDDGSETARRLTDYSTRAILNGNSDFDHRHVGVINAIYQLLFLTITRQLRGKLLWVDGRSA